MRAVWAAGWDVAEAVTYQSWLVCVGVPAMPFLPAPGELQQFVKCVHLMSSMSACPALVL